MTTRDNIIYYTLTAVVFVGIVLISLLFHNAGQPTNEDSERASMTEIISTISPFVTAGATVVLAFITLRYVRLTQEILKATNKPEVIIFLREKDDSIILCIQNIGTGYASDVKFTGDLSFKPHASGDKTLEELEPFKSGINYLGPGHQIEGFLFPNLFPNNVGVRFNESLNITVVYKDSANTEYDKTFTFELQEWENVKHFISPQNSEITSELKRIANILEQNKRV